jgi:hypothetical protein
MSPSKNGKSEPDALYRGHRERPRSKPANRAAARTNPATGSNIKKAPKAKTSMAATKKPVSRKKGSSPKGPILET